MESYIEEIGSYRSKRINTVLDELDIIKINWTGNGRPIICIKTGFLSLTDKDIKHIINDLNNGEFDHLIK